MSAPRSGSRTDNTLERLSRQVETLKRRQTQGRLQAQDQAILAELEKKLDAAKARQRLTAAPRGGDSRPSSGGGVRVRKSSIYWDPVFNPTGAAPPGRAPMDWNENHIEMPANGDIEYRPDLGEMSARDIPLPRGPALRFATRAGDSEGGAAAAAGTGGTTTYVAAPVVRDLQKESAAFVPASVLRGQQQKRAREG
ncbi:uncharacterized protein V1518DRAFT_372464 [Limtongia smithiae]|uniref:uncharacterized protein n=1 Tax=Limtongia smithiae TaxID=1125753 RepID=UPI0034CFD603